MKSLVEIKVNEKQLANVRRILAEVPGGMAKLMSMAINRTATSSKAEIVRRLRAEINMTAKRIRQNITIEKASRARWLATIDMFGKRVPLIHFGARQIKKGVSYKIQRSGGRKKIVDEPRPFIQTMPSGNVGVFRRWPKNVRRLPIIQLFGPSVGRAFKESGTVRDEVMRHSSAQLEKNIDQRVEYILNKWRASA